MNKLKSTIIIISILVTTISCSALKSNFRLMENADGEDTARIRVTSDNPVKGIPNSAKLNWMTPGAGLILGSLLTSKGYNGQTIGMPNPFNYHAVNSAEFKAKAEQPITLALMSNECDLSGAFIPQKGKDYQIKFEVEKDVFLSRGSCIMTIFDISEKIPVPVKIMDADYSIKF